MSYERIANIQFSLPEIHGKGWGKEIWIDNNPNYCGKILQFRKGAEFSMHYHKDKVETFYVIKGRMEFRYYDLGTGSMLHKVIAYGDVVKIPKGNPHKIVALEDSEIFEISTQHFESDSYRVIPGSSQIKQERKKVVVSGVFDCFHDGHRYLLDECAKLGDVIVLVNYDRYVTATKGSGRPIDSEVKRKFNVASYKSVKEAMVIGDSPLVAIMSIKPDYIAVGSDYRDKPVVGAEECKAWGGQVVYIDRIPGISTTEILNQKK